MKKVFMILAVMFVSLTVFGQTDSPVMNEFIRQYEALESKYREQYESKDFKQTELTLKEIVNLVDNVKLPVDEISEYQSGIDRVKAGTHYNLACTYALLNQKQQAVDNFEKSVALGYNDYYHILQDTDLDNIRKEKRFISLLKELSEKTYLSTLQQAGGYEKSDTVGLPHFYYETPKNARLQDVKTFFKLDSIAGNGDEITKMLNILYWIHNNIRHDGSNFALAEFDAIDLYNYHKATGKGINCRHLAISLNEMYLAMGWKSRYVTCLPKDESDQDCHVINCVWIDSLQKWIWVDPTFAAYVKDENEIFLSIDEVRERLIDGRPLILNEDANWNNQTKQTKEGYLLNYMAKNLYWLQVPVNSMFNPESRYRNSVNKYVSLLPMGYTRSNLNNSGTITHDPVYFWQKPLTSDE
jgi:hypothetical protein